MTTNKNDRAKAIELNDNDLDQARGGISSAALTFEDLVVLKDDGPKGTSAAFLADPADFPVWN